MTSLLYLFVFSIDPIDREIYVLDSALNDRINAPMIQIVNSMRHSRDISLYINDALESINSQAGVTQDQMALFWYAISDAIEENRYSFAHDILPTLNSFPETEHKYRAMDAILKQENHRIELLIDAEAYTEAENTISINHRHWSALFTDEWASQFYRKLLKSRELMNRRLKNRNQLPNTYCLTHTSGVFPDEGNRNAFRLSPKAKRLTCAGIPRFIP